LGQKPHPVPEARFLHTRSALEDKVTISDPSTSRLQSVSDLPSCAAEFAKLASIIINALLILMRY